MIYKNFEPYYFISKTANARRFVITDIHGHFETFIRLIESINLKKEDQLFLLGDFVDRGKNVKELLNWIIEHLKRGFQLFPLRGNHEEMMWQSHLKEYDEQTLKLPSRKWGKKVIDNKRKILPEYVDFIRTLPYYYILNNFYLVHAGFDFSKNNPFEDYKSMVWIKEIDIKNYNLQGKRIIHGHNHLEINEIISSVKKRDKVICLDNAVYLRNSPQYGNLVCLNIDTFELIIQKNIDK